MLHSICKRSIWEVNNELKLKYSLNSNKTLSFERAPSEQYDFFPLGCFEYEMHRMFVFSFFLTAQGLSETQEWAGLNSLPTIISYKS